MSRYNKVIIKDSDKYLDADDYIKTAVQPKSVDSSLYEQITNIMNNSKSKYKTVAEAVADFAERTGLKALKEKQNIEKLSKAAGEINKSASLDEDDAFDKSVKITPLVIKKVPSIRSTIENCIADSKGNLSLPAIIEKIKSIHKCDVSDEKEWEDENLMRLISYLNLKAKSQNPNKEVFTNLGKNDHSNDDDVYEANNDAFIGLMPNVK